MDATAATTRLPVAHLRSLCRDSKASNSEQLTGAQVAGDLAIWDPAFGESFV